MTKRDLIDEVVKLFPRFSRRDAEVIVNEVFESLTQALVRGERIEIRGFGSFSIRAYKEYQGRNPRTGEAVHVRPKRLAFFKVGKELRERVNNGRGGKRSVSDSGPTSQSTPTSAAGGGS